MLYLPNNRIKLETSTPKRVLPGATYNSDVQGAPVNFEPLSWKQQCWWLSRGVPTFIDCQFIGVDETGNNRNPPDVYAYPLFTSSPYVADGEYISLYNSEYINKFNYIKKNIYRDSSVTRIASDKPYILVNHPDDTVAGGINTTIYGFEGMVFNRILLCVGIYIPIDAIEAGKHTYVRAKVYGNFGRNYLVNNPYDDKYDFYNIHECDVDSEVKLTVDPDYSIGANEDYVKWPLYPKEIYNNLGIPERKSLEEIFGNTNPPRLDDYITSQYYEVKVGEPTYIYILLDAEPLNSAFYLHNKCSDGCFYEEYNGFTGSGVYYPVYESQNVRYGFYINSLFEDDNSLSCDLTFTYKVKIEELNTAPQGDNDFEFSNIENYLPSEYLNNGYFTRKIKYHFDPTNSDYVGPIRKSSASGQFSSAYKKDISEESILWAGTCYQRRGLIEWDEGSDTGTILSSDDTDGDSLSNYSTNTINPGQDWNP